MPNGEHVYKRGDVVMMITRPGRFYVGVIVNGIPTEQGEVLCRFWARTPARFTGVSEEVRPRTIHYIGKLSDFGIDLEELGL